MDNFCYKVYIIIECRLKRYIRNFVLRNESPNKGVLFKFMLLLDIKYY